MPNNKKTRANINHGSCKNSFPAYHQADASATRLSLRIGTRNLPSHNHSWFGFIDKSTMNTLPAHWTSNFYTKRDKIRKPFDFYRLN
jgi:hypothetical protein